MDKQVSIIINGTRYDAVEVEYPPYCKSHCDLDDYCKEDCEYSLCGYFELHEFCVFKKSDKKFEV